MNIFLRISLSTLLLLTLTAAQAQMRVTLPESNGLLWEITGNGLKQPSYVYGTMHVSSKLAFHLGDSFYYALQNSDMVALEQNLDTVVDDWVTERDRNQTYRAENEFPAIGLFTFDINKLEKEDINRAISYDPYVLNSIMFRTNEGDEDFQQETYLDLYIYRLGKKMGKIIGGVEDYKEAKALVKKAQEGAREDYKKKRKQGNDDDYYSFNDFDFDDACRKGNLKLIDSFERNTNGPKFLEYMLYVRNENMVRRMDSLMQMGIGLFTGVGCAHLGAERGVLNLLLKQGYNLRPVQSMANRISAISKKYDDKNYPLSYKTKMSPDSTFKAAIPGEWITAFNLSDFQVFIYPELVNGYFYTVYKLKTNGTIFGDKPMDVLLKVDSSLFESVPGEIISQNNININGYQGYEIINKTTEGDFQRYYIVVKPLEVYIFKLGGKKEYAKGKDADLFFKSIQFTTQKSNEFKTYNTEDFSLSFKFPAHAAPSSVITYSNKQNASFEISAFDQPSNTTYIAHQKRANRNLDLDTFDLKMLAENIANIGDFELLDKTMDEYHGFPRISLRLKGDKNRKIKAEVLLIDDKALLLAAITDGENEPNTAFFESINIQQPAKETYFTYQNKKGKYTVKTSGKPLEQMKEEEDEEDHYNMGRYYHEEEDDKGDSTLSIFETRTFAGKNGGEVIKVNFFVKSKYTQIDSLKMGDFSWYKGKEFLYQVLDTTFTKTGDYTFETYVAIGDTGTDMVDFYKTIFHHGAFYSLSGFYNKTTGKSEFLTTFLSTFKPSDTVWHSDPFASGFNVFYEDFYTKDSANRERLIKKVNQWKGEVSIKDQDAPKLISFIQKFNIATDYVARKGILIEELGALKHTSIYPALVNFYTQFGDTTNLKMAVLMAMSYQQDKKSFAFIKNKLITDLPIGAENLNDLLSYRLDDSLALSVPMFPDLLELTIVDEVGQNPYLLLGEMLDSSLVKPKVYKKYLNRIYLDGFYSLKRKLVREETKSPDELGIISETNKDKWGTSRSNNSYYEIMDYGYSSVSENTDYLAKARLLVPFKNKNSTYKAFFGDMHKIKDVEERFVLLQFCLKHNLPYPDTMVTYYAHLKKYRLKTFTMLQEMNKIELFPKTLHNNDSILYAIMQGKFNNYYSKLDSIKVLNTFEYIDNKKPLKAQVMEIHQKGQEGSKIIIASGIPIDSVGKVMDFDVSVAAVIKPKDDIQLKTAAALRKFYLNLERPNVAYGRYGYTDTIE